MNLPKRICGYYDPETSTYCKNWSTYIVAHDIGVPGDTGVLSSFRCNEHKDECDVHPGNYVLYADWYAKNILKIEEQTTDWDLT